MKKITKILIIIFMISLMLFPTIVQANSFKLNVTADKTKLNAGDTVTVSLNLSDINVGELGINTIESIIDYDRNIFEEITSSSIQSLNNWSFTYNSEDTEQRGKLVAVIIASGVTEDQEIGKITFKVKNNVEYTNTKITLKDITSNNGQELIKDENKEVSFQIGEEPIKDNGQVDNQDPNNTEQDTNLKEENLIVKNDNKDNTTSLKKLPKTGFSNAICFWGIVVLIGGGIYSYIRFKKMDK